MPTVNITTSDGERTPFRVDQSVVDRCTEQLADVNAVLVLPEREGTAYIPVRHVVAFYVLA